MKSASCTTASTKKGTNETTYAPLCGLDGPRFQAEGGLVAAPAPLARGEPHRGHGPGPSSRTNVRRHIRRHVRRPPLLR